MSQQHESVKNFLQTNRAELRQLARWTQQTIQELEQSVWFFVFELERERDSPVDLGNPDDKGEIFRRINRAYSGDRRRNKKRVSLDRPRFLGDPEDAPPLLDSIQAIDRSDPLEALLQEEAHAERLSQLARLCTQTYSQFAAYVVLILKFDCIKEDAAGYLAVTAPTLDRRIHRAFISTTVQPSLFDRIVSISRDFLPPQRFPGAKAQKSRLQVVQQSLDLAPF